MLKFKVNINFHLTMQVIYVLLLIWPLFRLCLVLKKFEGKCKEKNREKLEGTKKRRKIK